MSSENFDKEDFEVSAWQQEEVLKRIEKYKDHPELMISESDFIAFLNEE